MIKRYLTGFCLVALLALLLTVQPVFASTSLAATGFRVDLAPPAAATGGQAELTTGWHFNGLDWIPGMTAYFRGWSFTSNNSYPNLYAVVRSERSPNLCTRVRTDLYAQHSYDQDVYGGTVFHTHVQKSSNYVSQYFPASSAGTWFSVASGQMVTAEDPSCDFRGAHVHEEFGTRSARGVSIAGSLTFNSKYPDDPNYRECPCGTFTNDIRSNWTGRFSW